MKTGETPVFSYYLLKNKGECKKKGFDERENSSKYFTVGEK